MYIHKILSEIWRRVRSPLYISSTYRPSPLHICAIHKRQPHDDNAGAANATSTSISHITYKVVHRSVCVCVSIFHILPGRFSAKLTVVSLLAGIIFLYMCFAVTSTTSPSTQNPMSTPNGLLKICSNLRPIYHSDAAADCANAHTEKKNSLENDARRTP